MNNEHSVAAHWTGPVDEPRLQRWAEDLRRRLPAPQVSLGLVFLAPPLFDHAAQVLEILRVHARIPLLVGCSGASLIANEEEIEEAPGLVVGLFSLPGARLSATAVTQRHVEESEDADYWHAHTGVARGAVNGWLAFLDPFTIDAESLVQEWNTAYPGQPLTGGLASCAPDAQNTQFYLNGDVLHEGGVLLAVGGDVQLLSVISQGCTPIGDTWTLTGVEHNFIHSIANRRAYDVLADTFNGLSNEEKQRAQGNLFIGLVVNEYLEDFHRGDFLIRNLLGADPNSGILAVGALPRPGQTIQFQRRDAAAATEDMNELLLRSRQRLGGRTVYGGCLCCCNGRGKFLFGHSSHDSRLIQRHLGPFGMAGFFCNGEIGPVGERNFLHGYTASLGLFVKK